MLLTMPDVEGEEQVDILTPGAVGIMANLKFMKNKNKSDEYYIIYICI